MGAALRRMMGVFWSRKLEVVLVGLENSGKTTLLSVLSNKVPVQTAPTIGLNVKLVKEIISTGGEFSKITANETSVGYLTPTQWHEEMKLLQQQNHDDKKDQIETILVDVRNHKECQIGTFVNAIDPNTRTFSQFPKWVRDHAGVAGNKIDPPAAGSDSITSCTTKTSLDNKRILL